MKEKLTVRRSKDGFREGKTDWQAFEKLTDDEIAAAVGNDPDAAPIDVDWSDAELVIPPKKTAMSIRLDEDIVAFFKELGPGYQTRINAVLRHYMDYKRRKTG
jgi:uncharacterized protein (DUF4415 family)